eukprot:RCo054039
MAAEASAAAREKSKHIGEIPSELEVPSPALAPSSSGNAGRLRVLEFLIEKRTHSFAYFKGVLEGTVLLMGSVRLTREVVAEHCQAQPMAQLDKRLFQWFSLGLSLGQLLGRPVANGHAFVLALDKLMQEWEYCFAGAMAQGMRLMKSGLASAVEYA